VHRIGWDEVKRKEAVLNPLVIPGLTGRDQVARCAVVPDVEAEVVTAVGGLSAVLNVALVGEGLIDNLIRSYIIWIWLIENSI
jgi:hypothetical protein